MTSTKPYIVRAFYDWISDNQLTPYIVVDVNVKGVMVPMAFVNDGQITLNVSSSAVGSIAMAGDFIEFTARFSGKLEHLVVPYAAVAAIYAKENGAGTSLAIEQVEDTPEETEQQGKGSPLASVSSSEPNDTTETADKAQSTDKTKKGRASLKVIK